MTTQQPAHWSMPLGADPGRKGAVDAVVVGSGAGGGPVALTLARAHIDSLNPMTAYDLWLGEDLPLVLAAPLLLDSLVGRLIRRAAACMRGGWGTLSISTGLLGDDDATIYSATRASYALGRDRMLPAFFARISERRKTPWVALLFTGGIVVTVAVFLPIVFVEGIAGQLFRDQALTVTFSLLASLVVAVTVIPMLAALGARITRGTVAPPSGTAALPATACPASSRSTAIVSACHPTPPNWWSDA